MVPWEAGFHLRPLGYEGSRGGVLSCELLCPEPAEGVSLLMGYWLMVDGGWLV